MSQFNFADSIRHINCDVIKPEYGNIPTTQNWIIPARNLLLSTIGAMYSERIWLCALKGEYHRVYTNADKTHEFFLMASGLLTFVCGMMQGEPGALRAETIVESPFKNMSKAQVVYWALHNGIKPEEMLKTNSCYDDDMRACGKCLTCFKRNVAFTMNGIYEENKNNPWLSDIGIHYLADMEQAIKDSDYSHYPPDRIYETYLAYARAGYVINSQIDTFLHGYQETYYQSLSNI